MEKHATADGWTKRLADWFPDREFFMRSQGQVRFIKISSRFQKIVAASVVLALVAWSLSMAGMAWSQYRAQSERSSMLEQKAQIATAQERIEVYGDDLDGVVDDLTKRQEFLEAMNSALPADLKAGADTVTDSSTEAAETVKKVSAAFPQARALAELEARQLLYVERLTRYADRRSARAAQAIRQLGLNPMAMAGSADTSAMGGPLERLATSKRGEIDPRFERLGLSLARMAALERGLDTIPQVAPAHVEMVSSSYGYRRDPFTGAAAMHSGLDFRGPYGAPIYAAAKGTVSYVGWKSGYGKTVEIDHGNGLMTRYAHMSSFNATPGQTVAAGAFIGGIGSTGRSTGPHLHFEVRINDRAVDPRPFLEKAPNVLKEARAGASAAQSAGQR